MDAKDIQSDLHGLKRLYALLKKDGPEASNKASDSLDAHARLLLKNLLDTATKRVLKAHSEVIAGQAKTSGVLSPGRLQQPDEEQAALHSRLSLTLEGDQSCEKEIDSDNRLTPDQSQAGSVPAIELIHGQKHCRFCQQNSVKQLGSTEGTQFYDVARNSNTFADHQHQQNNVSDPHVWNSVKEIGWLSSEMPDDSKSEKQRQGLPDLNVVGDTDISSDRMAIDVSEMCDSNMETISIPEEIDSLSQEASKAIQQIELCMSALQMGSDHLHLFEKTSTQLQNCVPERKTDMQTTYGEVPSVGMGLGENFMTGNNLLYEISGQRVVDDFVYPMHRLSSVTEEESNQPCMSLSQSYNPVQPTKAMLKQSTNNIIQRGPVSRIDASSTSEEDKCRFLTKKVNKIYVQNVNATVEKIEPGNWIISSSRYLPSSVVLAPSETSYITRWPATSSNMESPYQSSMAMKDEQIKPSFSFMNPKNHPPNVMPGNLVNKKAPHLSGSSSFHGKQSDAQHKVGVQKDRHYTTAVSTSLQHHESDSTATDSYYNSSSRDCNSEDYSVTDGTRELHSVTSSKSSGSWETPLSHGSESQYSSYRSNSEEEVYSSSSGEGAHDITTSSGSENEGYSSYEQPIRNYARPNHISKQPTSKKSGPSMFEKAYGTNHYKQSGILKRLKDKLAVIFHHHHHQHHHHHKRDRTNDEAKISRDSSLEEHKGKAVISKRQDGTHGSNVVEKTRKAQMREKRQHSHFHGLMGGLVRHVRHSRKSKPGRGTADQLAEEYGRKRTLKKKSHWWQLVQHHGRSKLPNKTHMKLGIGKKKAHLKALPKIE